jgi:hypothetical protein
MADPTNICRDKPSVESGEWSAGGAYLHQAMETATPRQEGK